MFFEWDTEKATRNLRNHEISFHDAATVFDDACSTTYPDRDHSEGERRYLTIGMSKSGKILVVAHTETEKSFRIFSARLATRHERKFYEEERQ